MQKLTAGVIAAAMAVFTLGAVRVQADPAAPAAALDVVSYEAHDTLTDERDPEAQGEGMLAGLRWTPGAFAVQVSPRDPEEGGYFDARVRFASPLASGDARLDEAVLLWYAAHDAQGERIEAPAVLIVHSLHPQMLISKVVARTLASQGVHAFILQLPGFGDRHLPGQLSGVTLVEHTRQAVGDARRARDAIAALPGIKPGPIALQGTSLGGFVASVAGSLDGAFDPVLLVIAGADSYDVLQNGAQDAAWLKRVLAQAGYSGERLRQMLEPVEPALLAHRLDPTRTWLFSARSDLVVPTANSDLLAQTIGLTPEHHLRLPGDHYTVMLHLPGVVTQMQRIITAVQPPPTVVMRAVHENDE